MTAPGRPMLTLLAALSFLLALAGCGTSSSGSAASGTQAASSAGGSGGPNFPDVVEVKVDRTGDNLYSFDVTMTSPYDNAEHYADGWRVMSSDGQVYGEMTLDHDHASEQPFTRTQTGVSIPAGVTTVVVEGRDIDNGYGGATVSVDLPTS